MIEAAQVNTSRARRKWLFTGLVVVIAALTSGAGFWQLQRADDKRALLVRLEPNGMIRSYDALLAYTGEATTRLDLPVDELDAQPVYLENRIVDGRAGYEVFVRARIGQVGVLVNAGWVPAERTRDKLPQVALRDVSQLTGLWVPLTEGYLTGDPAIEEFPDGRRVQSLLGVDFGAVRPGVVLAEGWLPVTARGPTPRVGVMTHIGYAVQWFAMTLAVLVAWMWWIRTWRRQV